MNGWLTFGVIVLVIGLKAAGIHGYKWDSKTKKVIPLEHEARVISTMFELIDAGEGHRQFKNIQNH